MYNILPPQDDFSTIAPTIPLAVGYTTVPSDTPISIPLWLELAPAVGLLRYPYKLVILPLLTGFNHPALSVTLTHAVNNWLSLQKSQ